MNQAAFFRCRVCDYHHSSVSKSGAESEQQNKTVSHCSAFYQQGEKSSQSA